MVCGHRSAKLIGGTEANFWRLSCATLFLSIWAFGFGIGLGGVGFPVFFLSGILGIGLGDVALFQTLPRLGSRLSLVVVQCLTAPFGALIEWCWLGTRLSALEVGCGLTILAGVAIALAPGGGLHKTRREIFVGGIFGIIAAIGGALGAVLSRKAYKLMAENGEHIDGANAAFQRILGGLLIGGLCLLVVKRREIKEAIHGANRGLAQNERSKEKFKRVWPWVFMNSLAGQTLGVSCMQLALEKLPTGVVLAIIAMTPIVVIPFAFIFEGERPNLRSLFGGLIGVSGVVMLTLSRR